MSMKTIDFRAPERTDYYFLALVAACALYAVWAIGVLTSEPWDISAGNIPSSLEMISFAVVPLVALVLALWASTKQQLVASILGVSQRRKVVNGFLVALLFLPMIVFFKTSTTSLYGREQLVLLAMNILMAEVIARAGLMELILKTFGKTAVGINLALLSGALLCIVVLPSGASVGLPISWGIATSVVYYGTRSVVPLIFLDSMMFLPKLCTGDYLLMGITVVAIYIVVALLASWLCHDSSKNGVVARGCS